MSKFSTTILSAMLAGMDDKEDPEDLITMEAMSGLAKIFDQIDEGHVRPILINIALRIRPCFEKVHAPMHVHTFLAFYCVSLAYFSQCPVCVQLHIPSLEAFHGLEMVHLKFPSWSRFKLTL